MNSWGPAVLWRARAQIRSLLLPLPVVFQSGRDLFCGIGSEDPLHHVQRTIDSSGKAGGCDDGAVIDEALIADNFNVRKLLREARNGVTNSSRRLSIEQSGIGEPEGAVAYRHGVGG